MARGREEVRVVEKEIGGYSPSWETKCVFECTGSGALQAQKQDFELQNHTQIQKPSRVIQETQGQPNKGLNRVAWRCLWALAAPLIRLEIWTSYSVSLH